MSIVKRGVTSSEVSTASIIRGLFSTKKNWQYELDGTADKVTIPVWTAAGDSEIEFDVKLTTNASGSALISFGNDTWLRLNADGSTTWKTDTETNSIATTEDWVANEWMHFKITTWNSTTDTEVLMNGVQLGGAVQPLNAARTIKIDTFGNKDGSNWTEGIIKNVSLVDLDDSNNNRFYPLNEGSGTTAIDTLGDGSTNGTFVSFVANRWSVIEVSTFTPLDLFQNSEQGAWYDPSDLSTLFQDDAGTTPVTVDGDPVGLMLDKSQGLVLGTEQTVNGGFDTDSDWTLNTNWAISGGRLVASGVTQFIAATQNTLTTGTFCKIVLDIPVFTAGVLRIIVGTNTVKTVTSSGVYTYYGNINGNNTFTLQGDSGTPLECEIESVSVQEALGNHATQSVSASRPTYRTDGTYHWLTGDGIDDHMEMTKDLIDVTSNQLLVTAATLEDSGNNTYLLGTTPLDDGFELLKFGTTEQARMYIVTGSGAVFGNDPVAMLPSTPNVLSQTWDRTTGTGALYKDSLQVVTDTGTPSDILTPDTNYELFSGNNGQSSRCWKGNCYGMILVSKSHTSKERQEVEQYLAEKSGVTL
jgi:hypothetical protein